MRAVTDSGREIEFSDDPARAGVNNLLLIYQAIMDRGGHQVLAAGLRADPRPAMHGVLDAVVPTVLASRSMTMFVGRTGQGVWSASLSTPSIFFVRVPRLHPP